MPTLPQATNNRCLPLWQSPHSHRPYISTLHSSVLLCWAMLVFMGAAQAAVTCTQSGAGPNDQTLVISTNVTGNVCGGLGPNGDSNAPTGGAERNGTNASNNSITLAGGTVEFNIVGGGGDGFSDGSGGNANNNTVIITDGTVGGHLFGGYGGDGDSGGNASNNIVTVAGGLIEKGVYGGVGGDALNHNGGNANNNVIIITGGIIKDGVYGGFGGKTFNHNGGNANNNSITITGGTIKENVYGGVGSDPNSNNVSGSASNNTVMITGGTVLQSIYGGGTSGGNATHNRVILQGSPSFSGASTLYGGNSTVPSADVTTSNVLEIWTQGITVKNIQNFAEYHFLLPANATADTALPSLTTTSNTNLSNARVGVAIQGGGTLLQQGDRFTLVHNTFGGLIAPSNMQPLAASDMADKNGQPYQLNQGVSLRYRFGLDADSNNLYALVQEGPEVLEQTKAPVEGVLSGLALTQSAGVLASGAGISNAVTAAQQTSGPAAFGAALGSSSRYKSGSHVDVNGWGVMLGLAKGFDNSAGTLTAGLFFEAGWGNYDTYNSFADGQSVRGAGRSRYSGGGLLLRQDWQNGLYTEASVRAGRISTDWSSRDMVGAAYVSYDISSRYYGGHAGIGYIFPLNPKLSLDTYAKYFWTHQSSNGATIAGDPYRFSSVNSKVSRLGVRANYDFTDTLSGYTGAAWDYEFDSTARATAYGLSTPAPSLKGSTGVFELGISVQPVIAKSALTLEAAVQGYAGKRQGVGASLKAHWTF